MFLHSSVFDCDSKICFSNFVNHNINTASFLNRDTFSTYYVVAKNMTLFEFIARRNKHTAFYVMYVPSYVVICMVEKDGDPFQATSRPRQEGRRWQKSAKTRARASTVVAPRCSCSCKKRARMHTVVQKCISRQSCKFGPNQAGLNLPKLG